MKSIRGTQTEQILLADFAGEFQARNRLNLRRALTPRSAACAHPRAHFERHGENH